MRHRRRTQVFLPLAICGLLTTAAALGMAGATGAGGAAAVNPAFLPLGDGKVTTDGPRRGYVYACRTGFSPPGAGGAFAEGPWIRGDGTFDLSAKVTVDGSVSWPSARLKRRVTHGKRVFSGNGLPTEDTTGEFPIKASDDAYRYDRNPNSIRSQRVHYSLPRHPKRASSAGCLSGGPVGIAKNGVAIFDALDAGDRDAVAHEVQDSCGGHPQRGGVYHYHDIPSCLTEGEPANRASGLVGYALDGYPIYGPHGAHGRLLTDDDLDACHGQLSKVWFEGRWQRIYHYNATLEYPYTLGCFHGTPRYTAG